MYDYLIVGSGLFGATFAYEASKRGKKCLVIDKRPHIGGNIFTQKQAGITVHQYGAHIFHANNKSTWEYVNQFAHFNHFINSPIAKFKGQIFNLPFNMNTFNKLWGVTTPTEAKEYIRQQLKEIELTQVTNLEEQALSLVGPDIYNAFIKGYTEKQWGKSAKELPPFIIKRIPIRFTYNNNYFNDPYQGIPIGGYTPIIEKMLLHCDVQTNTDFFETYRNFHQVAHKLVFTGMIDAFFNYRFGTLAYRSLNFETALLDTEDYQGNAVVNYCDTEVPYTRIIEHKHFEFTQSPQTIITKEYPLTWSTENEPYYPINDSSNNDLYGAYQKLARSNNDIIFGGRLGNYQYFNMDQVIESALACVAEEFKEKIEA